MRQLIITLLSFMILTLGTVPLAKAASPVFSGRALGAQVKTALETVHYGETGQLNPDGGILHVPSTPVEDRLLLGKVLLAVTAGLGEEGYSEVALADLTLLPGTAHVITVEFVSATAMANCEGPMGASEVVNLTLGGEPVQVTGEPNQEVSVLGVLTLVINKQTADGVTALHLTLATGEEVVVAHASSGILCGE